MNNQERKFNVSDVDKDLKSNFQSVESEVMSEEPNILKEKPFDDQMVFEWDALEFEYHQKGNKWWWGLLAAIVLLAVVFGVMQNWMGMVLVMMSGLLLYQYAYKQPRKLHYIITKDGLVINDKAFHYEQITSYWLTKEGILYLNTKWWPPRLSVTVNNVDIFSLDDFLVHFVKKEQRNEKDTGDSFSSWLRF